MLTAECELASTYSIRQGDVTIAHGSCLPACLLIIGRLSPGLISFILLPFDSHCGHLQPLHVTSDMSDVAATDIAFPPHVRVHSNHMMSQCISHLSDQVENFW